MGSIGRVSMRYTKAPMLAASVLAARRQDYSSKSTLDELRTLNPKKYNLVLNLIRFSSFFLYVQYIIEAYLLD
jgi:hypothetical protein